MKKRVLFRGSPLTQSGYGIHSRQVVRWLLGLEKKGLIDLTIQMLSWGQTPWILDANSYDGLIGEMMLHSRPLEGKFDVTFQLQLPDEWDHKLGRYNVGITAGIETDRCNPEWISECNKMDRIVVPSQFTKKNLTTTGLVIPPINVIPESFPDCFRDVDDPGEIDLKLDTSFNYLVFGQITGNNPENDRKNIFYTVKWMCETLKDARDVGIVIKTNSGRNSHIDRNMVRNTLAQLINEVRGNSKTPPIYLVHGDLTEREVMGLMKHSSVKALVSLTRGEGFGLPVLEAAAAGLPVIATNWSGHTEFLNLGKWIQVDYRMSDLHPSRIDSKLFVKGTRWANPLEDDFKRKLKKFNDNSSIPREWAKDLQSKILENYSHERINAAYDSVFGELL